MIEAYLAEKHLELNEKYWKEATYYAKGAYDVAKEVATLLEAQGLQPHLLDIIPNYSIENVDDKMLEPVLYEGLVGWQSYPVCAADGIIYDPLAKEPLEIGDYISRVFTNEKEIVIRDMTEIYLKKPVEFKMNLLIPTDGEVLPTNLEQGDFQMILRARKSVHHQSLAGGGGTSGEVASVLKTKYGRSYLGICVDLTCGIGTCAEYTAITNALIEEADEQPKIDTIVAVNKDGVIPPCGRCRQLMLDTIGDRKDTWVIVTRNEKVKLDALLPYAWEPPKNRNALPAKLGQIATS